jgi:hypothetical protein
MEVADKLKQLLQQLQRAVSNHEGKIHSAVDTVGNVANKTTKGKFEDKIAKAGEKAHAGVGKVASNGQKTDGADGAPEAAGGAEDAGESPSDDADGAADGHEDDSSESSAATQEGADYQ